MNLSGTKFLRITMGLIISLHGLMKLLSGKAFLIKLGGMPPFVPDIEMLHLLLGTTAMLIELVGGILVLINYRIKAACSAIVLVLLIAFAHHLEKVTNFEGLMHNTWPLELALVFVAIALIHR